MKLKFSLIVALCAVMGFVACGKGKKNSSAKIRSANLANSKNNLNNSNGSASIPADANSTEIRAEASQKKAEAEKAASSEFSADELFTADLIVTGFDASNHPIVQHLSATQVMPVSGELGCAVISKAGAEKKSIEVSIKGAMEDEITTQLKLTFEVVLDAPQIANSFMEVTDLKIKTKKEDKVTTILEVSKSTDLENQVAYVFDDIDNSKLKKFGQGTKRLTAGISATKVKDKNGKDVTIVGSIKCATDFTGL